MYRICIFAGTAEGREIISFLGSQPVSVTACVATEYGEAVLDKAENLTVSAKRLSENEMTELFLKERYDLVIDATHPYAYDVTENIRRSCDVADAEYLRLLREESPMPADAVYLPDTASAVKFLSGTEKNILLTTGSKELEEYTGIKDFSSRAYVRVIPAEASLKACRDAGVRPAHIIAVQGPFTEDMNASMLRYASAGYLVTKESGDTGGFCTKAAAAKRLGVKLVVIGRPPQEQGTSMRDVINILCERFGCCRRPCVTIAGIGAGSYTGITEEVRQAVSSADCLIGAERMISAFGGGKKAYEAVSPDKISAFIMSSSEYQSFAVVMSGDTGFFSGTKKLLPYLKGCDVKVLPGISSLAYLCSRLKTSYEDIKTVSIHGREYDIIPDIRANSRVFVLTGGEDGVKKLCSRLTEAGLENVKMYIGERLSYSNEKITEGTAAELAEGTYDKLSAVLIENESPDAVVTHGLPDEAFCRCTDGDKAVPMTKSEVRSVCLSKLRLTGHAVCWDIGAGTGSVSVEMAVQAKHGHVYAIEYRESAIELLHKNKAAFSLPNLTIVSGKAPDVCAELPAPTHAFIGGSSGNIREIIAMLLKKNPNVRITAAAVSLETAAELTACMKDFDFTEAVSVSAARSREAGNYHLMNGQNPVYIFTMQKGGAKQ